MAHFTNPLLIQIPSTVTFLHQVEVQDKQFTSTRNDNYNFHEDSCILGYVAVLIGKYRHFEGDCFLHRHGPST